MTEDDRYLWDKSGDPDRDVERLEKLLAPSGHDGRPFVVPSRRPWARWAALAAAAVIAAAVNFRWMQTSPPGPHSGDGEASGIALRVVGEDRGLAIGQEFVATDAARELELGDVGRITLAVGSRLKVDRLHTDETRLYLARGELEARVSAAARPRFFQVGTPATNCVDLGCRYTLAVNESGDSVVDVHTGRVAFEDHGREVFVPAGATCRASPKAGAGTPRFRETPKPLAAALDAFDAAATSLPAERQARAGEVLNAIEALPESEALHHTLAAWHLLQDADAQIAGAAAAALEKIAGRPQGLPVLPPGTRPDAGFRESWRDRLSPEWW